MNFVQIIQLITILMPLIQSLIKLAESSDQPGEVKKEVVVDGMHDTFDALQTSGKVKELNGVEWDSISGLVSMLIDIVVKGFNKLGIFSKKS